VTLDLSPGAKAWIGLAAYVVVRDAVLIYRGDDTMSAVFGEAQKVACLGCLGIFDLAPSS